MRSVTNHTESLLESDSHDVVWVLTVEWPDGAAHYAHRAETLGGEVIGDGLVDVGNLENFAQTGPDRRGRRATSRLEATLRLDGPESPTVRERLFATPPESLEVRWGVVLLDEDGSASLSDRVVLFRGFVQRATVCRNGLRMECEDVLSARGRERFGTMVRPERAPEVASPAVGRMLPFVFGAPGRVALTGWRVGREIRAAREVLPDDTVVALRSVDGLPARGEVQLGDERFVYEAIDEEMSALGTSASPLSRPEAAWHPAGTMGRVFPMSGAFEWLAAGHACGLVRSVEADELPVEDSAYSLVTEDWFGRTVEKVVMDRWPVRVRHAAASSLIDFVGAAYWEVNPASTAESPASAVDDNGDRSAATLDTDRDFLGLNCQVSLDDGERRWGLLDSACVRIRLSASAAWETTTAVRLRCEKNAQTVETVLGRPGADGPFGPVEYDLDISPLVGSDWSALSGELAVEITIEGTGDGTIFQVWDVILLARYRERRGAVMAEDLTAVVEGLESSGALLENPVDLLRFFLTDEAGLGLGGDWIDEDDFTAARGRLESLGYVFSNVVRHASRIDVMIDRLLLEARCRLLTGGEKIGLEVESREHLLEAATTIIDESTLLREPEREIKRDADAAMLRELRLHYGCDFSGGRGASWRSDYHTDSVAPPEDYAGQGRVMEERLRWHNHGSAEVVADLGRALLDRYGSRRETVQVGAGLRFLASEEGDRVSMSDGYFPFTASQGRVASVALRDPSRLLLGLRFPVAGRVCWSHDAMTFMRHPANRGPKEIWIAGRLVATLRWDGWLRLTGVLREQADLDGAQEEAVVYDPAMERLVFGSGSAGAYTPRFAFDSDGNLLVAGSLREEWPREDVTAGGCVDACNEWVALTTAAGECPLMVFDAGTGRLDLRGTVTENCPF